MIDRINIDNLKSLRKVDLSLGRLNLFIGTNASGESNFLDALHVLQGVGNGFTIREILNGKPQWLFFPDADRANDDAMRRLEAELDPQEISLLCCPAHPEVEIYTCAAFRRDLRDMQTDLGPDIRTDPRLKEDIFKLLLEKHGDPDLPGEGRERMTTQSEKNPRFLYALCPELQVLRDRIAARLTDQ